MRLIFADTFYFLALLNRADDAHAAADAFAPEDDVNLVTTAWVLTELADGLANTSGRQLFEEFPRDLENDPHVRVIEPAADLWRRGVALYAARGDKRWSLTDCISFVVITDEGIMDALTADHHFEQAGFRALLRSS